MIYGNKISINNNVLKHLRQTPYVLDIYHLSGHANRLELLMGVPRYTIVNGVACSVL